MSSQDEIKKQSFLNKHKPMNSKQIEQKLIENEDAKAQYTTDMTALEENLRNFAEKTDPIVFRGKPLCWVKRPSKAQFEKLIPPDMMKYKNSPDSIPKAEADKYENLIYEMMAELIVNPKHDANWWKANSPLIFIPLFQAHLNEIYELVGIDIANF